MRIKKTLCLALTVVLTLSLSITAIAVPYQNYTITESGFYPEPQAYTPDEVIDSNSIGLGADALDGVALNKPQDLKQFDLTGDVLISDTGNNRIVILGDDLHTVKQIIKTWTVDGKEDSFNSPNGIDFAVESDFETGKDINYLYVCDTLNKRIVRFVFDEATQKFVYNRIFGDPDISKYFTSETAEMYGQSSGTSTEDTATVTEAPTATIEATATPEPTVAPEITATPEPTATAEATATAESTENTDATEAPSQEPEPTATPDDEQEIDTSKTTDTSSVTDVTYKPTKIVIDHSMRMFVVSTGCYQGLVELDGDGNFTKFFGATKTKQTLSSLLNRLFTAEAKSKRQQNLSTEYSNVALDSEGFVYGTISQISVDDLKSHFSSSSQVGAALRKLNAAGSDVLLRQGIIPPSGDNGDGMNRSTYSYIVDVAVSKNGLSSILDSQKGRVFTYTSTGELLYVFGALGQRLNTTGENLDTSREEQVGFTKGTSLTPVALELLVDDETFVILDSDGACMTTYKPTQYGLIMREAVNAHEERRYDDAVEAWNKILGMSSNSSLAYRGVAKVIYMEAANELDSEKQTEGYLEAADYFMKGYSQDEYGKAFYKYRDKVLEKLMPYIMTVIIVLAAALILLGWYKKFKHFIKTGGRPE